MADRKYAVVDVATDSTTVRTGAVRVWGIVVNTALSAHALPILDGSTTVYTVPASAAAGAFYELFGVVFNTSLIVDPNDAATGNITVIYERLNNADV